MRDIFSRTLAPFATTFSEFPLLSISPRCATIFSQPLPLEHAELKHQCPMEPWLRSEFAIDCRGTAPLINYQQCVRKKTKKYIFCIAKKAIFLQTDYFANLHCPVLQVLVFLQTWHIPVASLVLGRCLLADNICVCQLGLLKNCKHGKIDWIVKFNRLVFTSTTWCFSSNPLLSKP